MSTTRTVLLGIAAAGLVSATAGCATVSLGDVLDTVGTVGELLDPRVVTAGGAETASVYESVPRQYLWQPPVLAFGQAHQFKGWGGDCGFVLRPLWMADDVVVLPAPAGGPLVTPRPPLLGFGGTPLPGPMGGGPLSPAGWLGHHGWVAVQPRAQFYPANTLSYMRLSYFPCKDGARQATPETAD